MYTVRTRQKKRRKIRPAVAGIFILLSAAAGGVLYRLPLSLQDISRIIQLAADKIPQSQQDKTAPEEILRGSIYDRNFKELAVSYPLYSLYIHPAKNTNHNRTAKQLADIIHVPADELQLRFKTSARAVQLADDLDSDQVNAVERLHLDGISWKRNEVRYYPENEAAANVIGYTADSVGLYGIEKKYDLALQPGGYKAADLAEIDFSGNHMPGAKGTDLVLTLDLALQKQIDAHLRRMLREQKGVRGVALLMEPTSGKILASSIQPSFNPNYFWRTGDTGGRDLLFQPLFSRSTLQPILARVAAIVHQGEEDHPLLPITVAAVNFGLKSKEYAEVERRLRIDGPVADSLARDMGKASASNNDRGNGRLSLMQIGVDLASLVNGGWRHTPAFLDSVYDVEKGRRFSKRQQENDEIHVLSPAQGVRIRRDLAAHFADSKKGGCLVFHAADTRVEPAGAFCRYVQRQLFVGMIPDRKPAMLLLMAIDRDQLAPLAKKGQRSSMREEGKFLLANLYATAGKEQVAVHPAAKDRKNFARFLISRRVDYSPLPVEQTAGAMEMPRLVGLSLRKALRQLNGRKLSIAIEGSGKIVAQSPAPGVRLQGVKSCRLTLDSEI
ncbi:MAG TPA: PASTA domain-containing protein [Desulfobulbaceae bacterium]|nr:PASTA domain-containing protein [Desulfobulbaceae bacterium]